MGGPEGEIPAPWFANGGLAAVSPPCNRGSGLPSLPSPPVRGRTKCIVCTLCVLVKARLPSPWRLGTGTEDRGPLRGWKTRLKLLTYGFFLGQVPSLLGIVEGLFKKKITWSRPKVWFTCGRRGHGDAKVVLKVENEKGDYGFHFNRIHHFIPGSTSRHCESR